MNKRQRKKLQVDEFTLTSKLTTQQLFDAFIDSLHAENNLFISMFMTSYGNEQATLYAWHGEGYNEILEVRSTKKYRSRSNNS